MYDDSWKSTPCVTKPTYPPLRYLYMKVKGRIPKGMRLCHRCDTSNCRNLNHIFLGTQKDNMRDAVDKGRLMYNEHKKIVGLAHSKLTEQQVAEIRTSSLGRIELAVKYDVSVSTIYYIKSGKTWKWL